MKTRKTRAKKARLEDEYVLELDEASVSSLPDISGLDHDPDATDSDAIRRRRIRDSNKEFARRMTILQTWSDYWNDYDTREGEAYKPLDARKIIKQKKKISCPIESCGKSFTTVGGLKYHYARCNIKRSITCKVCDPPTQLVTRGELLRHLILTHYDDLPELSEQQKEIANTYLSQEPRQDKVRRNRRSIGDTEASINVVGLLNSYRDLLKRVFLTESFACRPYKDWQSFSDHWKPIVLDMERRRYYPPEPESVHVNTGTEDDECNTVMKIGEYKILMKDQRGPPSSVIFFTGGINTASAWLPKSYYSQHSSVGLETVAIAVNCCPMDKSYTYKEAQDGEGCIQFWTMRNLVSKRDFLPSKEYETNGDCGGDEEFQISLSYLIGHNYGNIFDMVWCPLGASWQPQVDTGDILSRVGLLALACGDGKIRILAVPHTSSLLAKVHVKLSDSTIEDKPIFKVTPIATLMGPGTSACISICWNLEDQQRLIAAGFANGSVALFDLVSKSPILYSTVDNCHIYRPLKSWIAHGGPVTGIALSSREQNKTFVATGSIDRQLKVWNAMDLNSCITSERAPITRVLWDFRFRGIITATDTAFTSYNNRVTYRYPVPDGNQNVTISTHRSTVWGAACSIITSSIATSDSAGELFFMPQIISKSLHSLYTVVPQAINKREAEAEVAVKARTEAAAAEAATEVLAEVATEALTEVQAETLTEVAAETLTEMAAETLTELSAEAMDEVAAEVVAEAVTENATEIVNEVVTELAPEDDAIKVEVEDESDQVCDPNQPKEWAFDFSSIERPVANKPTKFLLPKEHNAVETYDEFKAQFGLRFFTSSETKNDVGCDRPCDYPFSSIDIVEWSPNLDSFSHLLSAAKVGLCRIDKIQIVDQIYRPGVRAVANEG